MRIVKKAYICDSCGNIHLAKNKIKKCPICHLERCIGCATNYDEDIDEFNIFRNCDICDTKGCFHCIISLDSFDCNLCNITKDILISFEINYLCKKCIERVRQESIKYEQMIENSLDDLIDRIHVQKVFKKQKKCKQDK